MADITITHEDGETGGRFVATMPGIAEEGEITYTAKSPTRWTVDHTGVPASFKGMGVGSALAAQLVAEARARGVKLTSRCSFFSAQVKRHAEWADVIEAPAP